MDTPLVSVILATYNGSRYLAESIESVLSQDYKDLELIIVDDASTDVRISQIIQQYIHSDPRVRTFRNQMNMERSYSKNYWVQNALGAYVAFIDDDDTWVNTKLSKQILVIESSANMGIVGTFARFIDESGKPLGETMHMKIAGKDIKNTILLTNQFIQSSVLVRKDIFEKSWGFSWDMNLCEDYDLWLRILEISEWINIPELLVEYRVRSTNTTARNIYRMKYYSILLTWRYRRQFSGFHRAIIMRIILFPFNTVFLLRIWKRLFPE